jgi:hypothetical protein
VSENYMYELPPDEVRPGEIMGYYRDPWYMVVDVGGTGDHVVASCLYVDGGVGERTWDRGRYWPQLPVCAVVPGSPAEMTSAVPCGGDVRDLWDGGIDGWMVALHDAARGRQT